MKKIRSTAFISIIAILISLLASCGGEAATDNSEQTTSGTDATQQEENGLPFAVDRHDGQTFTILTPTENEYDYVSDESSGDIVEDAVYKRNQKTEELLGVKLNAISSPGGWNDRDNYTAKVRNSVLAGDAEYDLVAGMIAIVLPLAADGYFLNVLDIDKLNLDDQWWISGMTDNLAVGGKLYGFIGDQSLSMYKNFQILFFNSNMISEYQLDDPYQHVFDGTWTLDIFGQMVNSVSEDINGDGKFKKEDDKFGFFACPVANRGFMTSTEMSLVTYENGLPSFSGLSERTVNAFDSLMKLLNRNDHVFTFSRSSEQDDMEGISVFTSGRALFFNECLRVIENFRDMKDDFGMIPYPKLDGGQKDYHIQIATSTSMTFIPVNAKDIGMVADVCNAMSYLSMNDVVPKFYEVALKEKYARDENVRESLDIIRKGASLDFTFAYHTQFDPYINCLTEFKRNQPTTKNIMSYYDKNASKWQATLDGIVDAYSKLD